jgi:hypothetical protein
MRHDRRDFIRTGLALVGTTGLLTSGPGPMWLGIRQEADQCADQTDTQTR